ncbi:MAG: FlgB family protein [Rhodobacteraceae bacterium]|nr:FlgB family protein [Paracoccaceae bacterium]
MFADLNVFKTAHALAVHAGQRQAIVAQNVANADTPGFKARDIAPFNQLLATESSSSGMNASRSSHLNGISGQDLRWETITPKAASDPNGNSVSIENELLRGVAVKRQHDRAVAIYKFSLSVLRTSLGRI